jgi:hypothetical protein
MILCSSSIGKDTNTPSKPIIPPLKKESNSDKQSDKVNIDKSKSSEIKDKEWKLILTKSKLIVYI